MYDIFLGIGFLHLYLYVQSLSSSSMPFKITFGYGSSVTQSCFRAVRLNGRLGFEVMRPMQ